MARPLMVLFAGGGTGGHLYPAIAIAAEVRRMRPGAAIVFVGSRDKIEGRVVPAQGYEFMPIRVSGFRRSLSLSTALFPARLAVALVQSFLLIKRVRPSVVVGTGGYVSGPPVYAASLLGIPTLLQEQNSFPGITTRLLAARANEVHISFDDTRHYLKRTDNIRLTGNPTRATIGTVSRAVGAAAFGLHPELTTLLVFGGSLGAASINAALARILPALLGRNVQVIWQTGAEGYAAAEAAAAQAHAGSRVAVRSFIENMDAAYGAADLAVCRAGATTLAELTRAGLPSVLVPYPFAAADHQTANARALSNEGAAEFCADGELTTRLEGVLGTLLDDADKRHAMADRARALSRPDAALHLAQSALALAGETL